MLTSERIDMLDNFCKQFNIKFNDMELLNLAFRHKSFNDTENDYAHHNNERLEFLGDSVLEICVTNYLYENIHKSEGELARIKSAAVSEETLSKIAKKYNFNNMLLLGQGEEMSGGRDKKAILADSIEAVLGAYFLDQGFESVQKLVRTMVSDEINLILNNKGFIDYKTELQEYCQKVLHRIPKYEVVNQTGPDHDKVYHVIVHVLDKVYGPGKGKSKKEAEHNAAKIAMENINSVKSK